MNHQDQRLTRRVTATNRKSDDTPHHNKEATVDRNCTYPEEAERRRRRQAQGSYNIIQQRETGLFLLRRDRDRLFFLTVAALGVAFVIFAYYVFSVLVFQEHHQENDKINPVVSHNYYNQGEGEEEKQTSTSFPTIRPLHVEFENISPSNYGKYSRDLKKKKKKKGSELESESDDAIIEEAESMDFGGLDLVFFENSNMARKIGHDAMSMQSEYRDHHIVPRDDDQDNYYAYDDDVVRNPFRSVDERNLEDESNGEDESKSIETDGKSCRRISEHRLYFPNCNSFHETPMLDSQATYIGRGTYREAMRLKHYFGQENETIVVKDIRFSTDLQYDSYEFTRMDALIAERLTSSHRIYNIYGTCGIGIIAEYFTHGDIEEIALPEGGYLYDDHDEEGPLYCYNDLPGITKLQISLHMAEAIADLHGYPGGIIVHQDIKMDQFFLNPNMNGVILNDFNRAEFMMWDEHEQKYCGYKEGFGMGNWRSPEEYYNEYLNEKVDVFSLGNNIYTLLTGLWVFYDIDDYATIQELVASGERAYIDPRYKERSLAEAKLVEVIDRCHEYLHEDRPTIFEVVDMLWKALKLVYDEIETETESES